MKKMILLIFIMIMTVLFIGCKKEEDQKQSFLSELSAAQSYKVDGVMETFFENGRKQSNFTVYYKANDNIKVILQDVQNSDKQIILKNKDGVHVLVPSVNKQFKIKSTWPTNASYPYLLQSIAKDIANDNEAITTENETTYTIQTKTKMHTDAEAVTQKIIFSKETNKPTEVLVYENDGDLFIRCVFVNIEFGYNINDEEFDVNNSMNTAYLSYGEDGLVFNDRSFNLPTYCPEGLELKSNENVKDDRAVMLFSGENNLTIIQEFIDYNEEMVSISENGDIIMVMGTIGVISENYIKFIFEGIEYTIASNTLSKQELLNVSSSYMQNENK